jgi:polysaccharide biosynthesis/export protein
MSHARPCRRGDLVALALAGALLACASHRPFLWVEDVPPAKQPEDPEYRIAAGDVLGVRVWNQESMSTPRARVRDDGKVSLPFLQDVQAAGMTLSELSARLSVRLKTYVQSPVVTVTLEERRALRVPVLGEVAHAGTYELQQEAGVLEALAMAGGLTQWARRDGIYVLRYGYWADGNPEPARIRFRYDRLAGGAAPAATFKLRPGDVVVVE